MLTEITLDVDAYSINLFCIKHTISRAFFYKLCAEGAGPRLMRVGRKVLISREAAEKWRRQRESEPNDS